LCYVVLLFIPSKKWFNIYWNLLLAKRENSAALFCVVWKLVSSKRKDQKWIDNWEKQRQTRDRFLQREIYLLEELEWLGDGHEDEMGSDETSHEKEELQETLEQTSMELWLHKQAVSGLF
jgi:hypothetical protein